ncbi:MAG: amidohydrolase family protein [Planctomycetales bacterium]
MVILVSQSSLHSFLSAYFFWGTPKNAINPALAHGMGHVLGSVTVGKLADLVLWRTDFFGVKPEIVIKSGVIAWAQMGDPNASIPTPQPVRLRPMFGALGQAAAATSLAFVSQSCVESGVAESHNLQKNIEAVKGCREVRKKDLPLNDAEPHIEIDPETYEIRADGQPLICDPADKLPLAQRYFLF